ncbi:MAG: hypothetical protein WAM73_18585 [Desulfobacterales bacterium]
MRVYIGYDDTDSLESAIGTGKLARGFEDEMTAGAVLWGVIRQQLLVRDDIPYTSHNSAACLVIDLADRDRPEEIICAAVAYLERKACAGSDPGVCVAWEKNGGLSTLVEFGRACTCRKMSQRDARKAAGLFHLSGHGGTDDGIIGAAAAVGLTHAGWCGRFIEFGRLRDFDGMVPAGELMSRGIQVVSIDRDAKVPAPAEMVLTNGWVRPHLLSGRPVLLVRPAAEGLWENIGAKRVRQGISAGGSAR